METVAPFKEVIEEVKAAGGGVFRLCYQCGKCDVVCPWNRVRDFSMRRLIREAAFGLTEIEGEDVWRCTTCGNCPRECPRGVEQIDLSVSLRRVAAGYGVFPPSVRAARAAAGSCQTDGNPLSGDRAKRADWAAELSVKPFEEGMEYCWFACCYQAYDPRLKKVAAATAKLLEKAGVSFGNLGAAENCCGESIRKTGAEDVFKTLARTNIKTFVDRGVKKILVNSPHCYHAFKNEYAEFKVNFEVVHVSELLFRLIREGRLKLSGECAKRVTW
ncbi:MAG: (Fe-S)-binding protein, partial [Planctomycetes bacterium]|nr:(Fe-S)-binding protein [Planctomycetota bacterium]